MNIAVAAIAALFCVQAHARTELAADAVYYAAPGGIGDCRTPASACSPQAAWRLIRELDLACHRVTVELEEGVYREPLDLLGALTGGCAVDAVTFHGNLEHPDRVSFSVSDANAITVREGAMVRLEGLEVASTSADFNTGGHGLIVYAGGARAWIGAMAFRDCTATALDAADGGQIHAEQTVLALTGFTPIFALAEDGGRLYLNGTLISLLAPYAAFSGGMFHASRGALLDLSGTLLNVLGGPLFGYVAIAESNAVVVLLGMRYPRNMGQPQLLHGGQVIP